MGMVNWSYPLEWVTQVVELLSWRLFNLTGHGPEQSAGFALALIRAVCLNSRGPFPPPVPYDSGS